MAENNNLARLAEAGILEATHTTAEDRAVIDQLTGNEVTVLIQVATRLYPGQHAAIKAANLRTGRLRIMLPL